MMSAEEDKKEILAPMMESGVHAGFPSPAQDYINSFIDLNKELVRHPAATFFARVVGDSMVDADVNEGDVLVVDKSIEPKEGDMAVCFIDGVNEICAFARVAKRIAKSVSKDFFMIKCLFSMYAELLLMCGLRHVAFALSHYNNNKITTKGT